MGESSNGSARGKLSRSAPAMEGGPPRMF
nr:hypothetical protein [Sicyoidochytrium minutum DNA virus]